MASQTPVWFEQKYIRGAIAALQAEGFATKGMAQLESNIKGSSVEWKLYGKGKATVMSPTVERRPVMNAGRSILTATMTDYEANEWINMTDLEKMSEIGAKTYMGVTFMPLADEFFNAPAAGVLDGYIWMKNAVGFCTNYDLKSRIDYVPTEKAYFVANTMGMCARTLLPGGIRRLRFKNDATLTRQS